MHDFIAPLSPQLTAALNRLWRGPTAGNRLRVVVREPEARAQTQLDDWERDGGTAAPQVQTEG